MAKDELREFKRDLARMLASDAIWQQLIRGRSPHLCGLLITIGALHNELIAWARSHSTPKEDE